jgi:isoquinoline 1-oxidoreductase beta subunit
LALPLQPGPGETAFDAWIRVAHDGVITVSVPQLEMGQGIATLLAQIVAVEIGADWRQVGVSFAPVSELYANARWPRAGRNCGCPWRPKAALPPWLDGAALGAGPAFHGHRRRHVDPGL